MDQTIGPNLDLPSIELLGALAPCEQSGPHGREALRRRTRLLPSEFDAAVATLAGRGWIAAEGSGLWVTRPGEEVLLRLFA